MTHTHIYWQLCKFMEVTYHAQIDIYSLQKFPKSIYLAKNKFQHSRKKRSFSRNMFACSEYLFK